MAVRYDGAATVDLQLSDTPDAAANTFGKLSTLLAWHAADPVSAAEATRNDLICSTYQRNRNPSGKCRPAGGTNHLRSEPGTDSVHKMRLRADPHSSSSQTFTPAYTR